MTNVQWESLNFIELPDLEISTTGIVRDIHTNVMIDQQILSDGSRRIWIPPQYHIGEYPRQKSYMIHRLVAMAFKQPATGKYVIPKDGDYTNYDLDNLEWVEKL